MTSILAFSLLFLCDALSFLMCPLLFVLVLLEQRPAHCLPCLQLQFGFPQGQSPPHLGRILMLPAVLIKCLYWI